MKEGRKDPTEILDPKAEAQKRQWKKKMAQNSRYSRFGRQDIFKGKNNNNKSKKKKPGLGKRKTHSFCENLDFYRKQTRNYPNAGS